MSKESKPQLNANDPKYLKGKEKYKEFLKKLDIVPDNHCRICNDIIYYYDSDINTLGALTGKSFQSTKTINKKTYILSVCQECLEKEFPEYREKNKSRVFNVMQPITQYAFNISNDDYESVRGSYAMTLNKMISKHGETEGKKKWDSYCKRQAETNTLEYKKEKYGWDEKQFKEYNSSRSVTLKNCIKRHGKEKGTKIFKDYCEKQKTAGITLEYFIETYGEEAGKEKYYNMLELKLKAGTSSGGYSNISQIIFNNLEQHLKEYGWNTFYATKNKEKIIRCTSQCRSIDYYIEDLKLAVEYNGNVFHGNPKLFEADDTPMPFDRTIKAKDLWWKDNLRYKSLKEEHDIDTIVIWESDEVDYDELVKQILSYKHKENTKQ